MEILLIIALGASLLLCALAWRLTRGRPSWLRLLPTTLAVALTIAPGVLVGHGIVIVPVIIAVFSGNLWALYWGLRAVLIEWVVFYIGSLLAILVFKQLRGDCAYHFFITTSAVSVSGTETLAKLVWKLVLRLLLPEKPPQFHAGFMQLRL